MNEKMYVKSSRTGIRVLLIAGFLYAGSYAQDSLGVQTPVDPTQKNTGTSAVADQSTAQPNSVVAEKPVVAEPAAKVAEPAAKKVAAQPAAAKTAAVQNTESSTKGNNEKAAAPEQEFRVGYVPIKNDNKTTVKSKEISKEATSNALKTLKGRAAGVNVQSSGFPGDRTSVDIRGVGTINNNNPLYIVDGVQTMNIDHINPNDIESISVLKDVSETAIYGARGANGVVLVTTKTAK